MRRKSERKKTASTSGSPEKKAVATRRGGRRSVAANAEQQSENDEKSDVPQTEEEQLPSGKDSDDEEEEVVVPKSTRKKLTRGGGGASKAGSEDREEPRPSRSRRRITVQPSYVDPVEEEDEFNLNLKAAVKLSSPAKVKSASPSKAKRQQPVEEVVVEQVEEIVEEPKSAPVPSPKKRSPTPEKRSPSPKEQSPTPPEKEKSASPERVSPVQEESTEVEHAPSPSPLERKSPSPVVPDRSGSPVAAVRVDSPVVADQSDSPLVSDRVDSPVTTATLELAENTSETTKETSPDIEIHAVNDNSSSSPVSVELAVEQTPTEETNNDEESIEPEPSAQEEETLQQATPLPQATVRRPARSSSSSSSESEPEQPSERRTRKASKSVKAPAETQVKTTEPKPVDDQSPPPIVNSQKNETAEQIVDAAPAVAEKENQAVPVVPVTVKAPVLAKPVRKRKWLTQKSTTETKPQILAISTDSLKNLISDVRPVPLSDVKLESSADEQNDDDDNDDSANEDDGDDADSTEAPAPKNSRRRVESTAEDAPSKVNVVTAKPARDVPIAGPVEDKPPGAQRKVVRIVHDDAPNNGGVAANKVARPPSPAKFNASCILYITNLVRPFTVLQLKGLLARTGQLSENGFWIDKIKSKCFVKYETEDEAVETRHALHGVRWPTSNPKCLNVDFGSEANMDKAIASTLAADPNQLRGAAGGRDERVSGWERFEADEKRDKLANRPVREWDLGKKEELLVGDVADRGGRGAAAADAAGAVGGGTGVGRNVGADRTRDAERGDRRKRSTERGTRRTPSVSPGRKFQKKENEPPLRLLDDLFRKTKSTPCIYWLPLTAEQIAVKEEARRLLTIEHRRKIEENLQKDKERQKEREKERDRPRNRDRSGDRRRDTNARRSRSRDGGGGGGGDRDRDRRRY